VIFIPKGGSTGPVCGDGKCEAGETCSNCSSDCGECSPTDKPVIEVDKPSITMAYRIGDPDLPKVTIDVTNSGPGTLPKLTAKGADGWLVVSVTGTGNSQTLTVTLAEKARNAVPKEYQSKVTLSGDGVSPKETPLTLTVTPAPTGVRAEYGRPLSLSQKSLRRIVDMRGSLVGSATRDAGRVSGPARHDLSSGIYLMVDSRGKTVRTIRGLGDGR
jgi:hypothetical protein